MLRQPRCRLLHDVGVNCGWIREHGGGPTQCAQGDGGGEVGGGQPGRVVEPTCPRRSTANDSATNGGTASLSGLSTGGGEQRTTRIPDS